MTKVVRRVATYRWPLGAAGLLVVVAFGALLQGGVLAPKLQESGAGGGGPLADGRYFSTSLLRNVSWPAWTVTGVHLSANTSAGSPIKKSSVEVGVAAGSIFDGAAPPGPPQLVPKLTVRPGQTFSVVLLYRQSCPGASSFSNLAAAEAWLRAHPHPTVAVKAYIDVATALGNQTTTTTLYVSCSV